MNTIRRLLLLASLALAGLFLSGCASQLLIPTSTPWPTRTPRPTRTTAPTITLTPTITPTPTEIVPSQAGTALPQSSPVIAPANAARLALFGEWGSGIPLGLAISPDGSRVAVASTRGLFVYDAATLALQRSIDPGVGLRALAYAPDGTLAAGADDGRVLLYTRDGQLTGEFEAHDGAVFALAFSPEGERLASGGWDRAVKLWRPDEARQLMSFNGHTSPPRRVSFSPDGELLYSWSPEDQLRVLPLSGRNPPNPIYLGVDANRKSGSSAAFSGSGEFFAVDQDERVRLIFTRSGNTRVMLTSFAQPVERVALSPDGELVATTDRDGIRVWNGASGALVDEFQGVDGSSPGALLAFSPDGSRLVSVGKAVRIWALEAPGAPAAESQPAFQTGYRLFSRMAPDGESLWNGLPGGRAQAVRLSDGALLPVTGPPPPVQGILALSKDGALAASAGADRAISVWRTADGAQVASLAAPGQVPLALAFSPDGSLLASASGEPLVRVFDLGSGVLAAELEAPAPVTQVSFSPDGESLAGGSRAQVHLWEANEWTLQETLPGRGLVFSPDGGATARFVDDAGGTQVEVRRVPGEPVRVDANGGALAFSPAGDLLAVSGIMLSVHDARNGERLFETESPAVYGRVLFSLDGRRLLLTAPDGVVYVYAVP